MAMSVNGTSGITYPDSTTESSASIGYGQTWQNVTSSRAFGTTYTNSTGRPIMVIVTGYGIGDNDWLYLYVAGNLVAQVNGGSSTGAWPVQAIVPPGATYQASSSGATTLKIGRAHV